MDLQVMQSQGSIIFNYEELKHLVTEATEEYRTRVYGEDEVAEAKGDRAKLNSLKKALNDERIKRQKIFMQPFELFKSQVDEIIGLVDEAVKIVDEQVKNFEDGKKNVRRSFIESEIAKREFYGIPAKLWANPKWLNASVTEKGICEALDSISAKIKAETDIIAHLKEYSFEAAEFYRNCFDLVATMNEVERLKELATRKKEAEAKLNPVVEAAPEAAHEEPAEEPERRWIGFEAYLSTEDAKKLGAFMKQNGIQYRKPQV